MSDRENLTSSDLEEQLAEYADKLIANEDVEGLRMVSQGTELGKLQDTVERVVQAFSGDDANEAISKRIFNNLVETWRTSKQEKQPTPFLSKFWNKMRSDKPVWRSGVRLNRVLALVSIALIVLVAFFMLPLGFPNNRLFTGTAGDAVNILPSFLIITAVVLGIIFIWFIRRKR
ncbi:MAG: hypothetical protein AB1345_07045 [Chloroflexota bacterium]